MEATEEAGKDCLSLNTLLPTVKASSNNWPVVPGNENLCLYREDLMIGATCSSQWLQGHHLIVKAVT